MGWPKYQQIRRILTGKMAVISLFSCLSLVAFDAVQLYLSHQERLAQAGREVGNLAGSLAKYSEGVFRAPGSERFALRSEIMRTDLFQHAFAGFDIGPRGSIVLIDDSGVILVRQPFVEGNVGRNIGSSAGFHAGQTLPNGVSFRFRSALDGKWRVGAYSRVDGTQLRIMVSRAEADILAPWWREARINAACLLIVLIVAISLSLRIEMELRDRAHAERLYRLLADNSEDAIICGSLTGACRYISPSLAVITGHAKAKLRGNGWLEQVLAPDQATVRGALKALQSGADQVSARYRYLRRDGGVVWVEMRARLTQDKADGAAREFVANIRDITRQKQAEEELEEANADLSAMSITDALTGISNRRHFDQMLRKEWNRAMRTASPVSLLMVDTDHFKAYNDLYGHPMGDQCLRQVAQTLSQSVLRAGDLVTRYGGEEFAIILPDTIAEMAASVGERVIEALQQLAMPHHGAERGIVTVSIGVASLIPKLGSNPADLVIQADTALYQAKHNGRATLVVAPPAAPTPTPVLVAGQRNAA